MPGSILILTEDGADDAPQTVKRLVTHILRLAAPAGWESEKRLQQLRMEPPDSAQIQHAVKAQRWKSTKSKDYRDLLELASYMADRLIAQDSFVVFHIDGDCPWSRRPSEYLARFDRFLNERVFPLIDHRLDRPPRPRPRALPVSRAEVLAHLILMVPYYSIESWLYQHTAVAVRLCQEHHQGAHVGALRAWQRDRGLLEEVVRIKARDIEDPVCLGQEYNQELAGPGFPADEVYGAGKSFTETVDRFLSCTGLMDLLRQG